MNAEGRMQKAEGRMENDGNSHFCLLPSAFCLLHSFDLLIAQSEIVHENH
jgi:hypothetical protein